MTSAPVEEDVEIVRLEETDPEDLAYEETDDPLHRTHIINPPDNPHISYGHPNMEAQEVVNIARRKGLEITALCGYKFVPKHNPDKYDACEACVKVAGDIMRAMGE